MHWLHQFGQITVCQFTALSDNYGYLVHDGETGECTAIDTPDAARIAEVTEELGWKLGQIWNTHWHMDHTGGNEALKSQFGCTITGPVAENGRIPAADRLVKEDDQVSLGTSTARIIDTPGHTTGHIVYYMEQANIAFVGDTLFALGCGRLFEGTASQMWHSLLKLRALPDETTLFCAHEYTKANAAFALSVEPGNSALQERSEQITQARNNNQPTVPTNVKLEKETNPFLRADVNSLITELQMQGEIHEDIFAEIRKRKDNF